MVKTLVYCSNCGAKIDDEVYFCPKCGTKTQRGKAANASYPSDELRDAFYQVGVELERAFTTAAEEMHTAFKKVSQNMQQKPVVKAEGLVVCPKCGTQNPSDSIFCNNCGTRIAPIEESRRST